MRIESRSLTEIKPYENNPRINDGAVDAVAKSIREFGWRNPIVVDRDGVIVAGHTRYKAAQKLGLAVVPVHVASDLTPEQARAFRLADNKSAELAEWDYDLLPIELSALKDGDFDLSVLGFTGEELTRYLSPDETATGADGIDPDVIPDVDGDAPVSRRGEVYRLGRHRVMCGDNGSADDMRKLAGGVAFDLCFTSPPYMQQRQYGAAKELVGEWDDLMDRAFAALPMKDDGQIIVNLGLVHKNKEWIPYWSDWLERMRKSGWLRFALYIWDQLAGMPGSSKGRLAPCFELLFHFCKRKREPNKIRECKCAGDTISAAGQRNADGTIARMSAAGEEVQPFKIPDAIIRVSRQNVSSRNSGYDHPAAFSWRLPVELINAFTQPGEAVLDQFCGSGSTIIACEHTDRRGFGMEIDPSYCDIIRKRWAWQLHGRNCDWQALTPPIDAPALRQA